MAFPVTLNGRTYTLADFAGTNYVEGLPDAFEDFVTQAGSLYSTTSTTSNAIGTGSKTFTVEASKPYQVGTPLRIADTAAPSTNWMDAIVTSYSGTTLIVNAVSFAGSGTKTAWSINIGGGGTSYTGTLPVAQGGTGATTAADARTNLDTYSKAEADSRFLNVSGEASDVTMTGNVTIGDAGTDTLTINAATTIAGDNASIDFSGTTGNNFITAKQGFRIDIDSDNNQGATSFGITRDGGTGSLFNANESGDITLYASDGTTAKALWDASAETLLIGKTTTNFSNEGPQLASTGASGFTADGNHPLSLNRLTSDGAILRLFKDSVNIGELGTIGGDLHIGQAATGLRIDDGGDRIMPYSVSGLGTRDDAITLGSAAGRFKNLYLSGGVYLGGTGSANLLDDYEEGTWTPVYKGATTAGTYSYNEQQGQYIKIGRQVTAWFNMTNITDVTAGTGDALIGGFPFAASWQAGFNGEGLGTIILNGWNNVNGDMVNCQLLSGTNLNLYRQSGATNATAGVLVTEKSSNGSDLRGFITYQAE